MKITNMRVENLIQPIQIDAKEPTFGWNVTEVSDNWKQKSYQIRLGLSEDDVVNTANLIWDSGIVNDSSMVNNRYTQAELVSDTRYYWTVAVTGADGEKCISEPAWFETALLTQEDWKGRYIGETKDHTYHIFRKTFDLGKEIQKAKLYVCGLGHHEFYINGEKVSDRVLEPGWTDYRKTCFYSTYDVTGMVQCGANAAGVKLGDGMYNVPGGRYVYYERSYGKIKLNVQLNITYTDGSQACIVTDESWRMAPSPVTFCCIYGGEDYDARLEQDGFSCADFVENETWQPVTIVEPPLGKLASPTIPPMKIMQTYQPTAIKTVKDGTYLYDLGKNFSGWVRIKLRTDGDMSGTEIRMTPAEFIGKDLELNPHAKWKHQWKYTLNEKENQEFAPEFTYTGFRYVLVEGAAPSQEDAKRLAIPHLVNMTGEFIYPELETTGEFSCSNQLFNQIHEIIKQAILSNVKSYMTDCPHREKLPWLEETHLIGPGIMYNYNIHNLLEKQERDMRDAQRESGLIPDISPEYVVFGYHEGFVDSPEWGSACIINPWYVYKRYGDVALLHRNYDVMKKYLDYLTSRTHHHVLHHGLGDWLDIGPVPPHSQNTPVPVVATCVYYYDLRIMKQVAAMTGHQEDEAYFAQLMEEVYEEYNLQFYDNQTARYANGSQAAQAMSLIAGLVAPENEEKVVAQLRKDIVNRGYAITAGDIGHPFLIAAAMKYGLSDVINEMTNITDKPGYGYQVVNGATTLTESWDGPNPEKPHGSQNHFMLGGIEEWFYGGLAGLASLRNDLPFDEILIKPHFAKDMEECHAWMTHPYGKVSIDWKRAGGQVEVALTIPPNVTAYFETEDGSKKAVFGSGSYRMTV